MICAHCGVSCHVQVDACPDCGAATLLDGSYALLSVVGRGATGTTYRARRVDDGTIVAVKELLLKNLDAFEVEERFQREAEVLRTIDHPGVPRYLAHMSAGVGKQTGFYLVQEFIEGKTLAAELSERRFTEAEIVQMLMEICEILTCLHAFRPPVIHRDVKPANIMRRQSDGSLVLIDFGSVRAALVDPQLGGDTVAGTFGYMAPEQFAGHASPASDLYGLGATALALLSRREPQEFMDHDHKLDWESAVHAGDPLKGLLRELLRRDPVTRPDDATAIASRLGAILETGVDPRAPRGSVARTPVVNGSTAEVTLWADPPPAPRQPPSWTMRNADPGATFNLLFGGIFGGVGGTLGIVFTAVAIGTGQWIFGLVGPLIGLIFGGIGGTFFYLGLQRVKRARSIYRDGVVAAGRLREVRRDWSIKVNGRSPLQLTYLFEVDGRRHQGSGHSWDEWLLDAPQDAPVAVLHDPKDPSQNLLYLGR